MKPRAKSKAGQPGASSTKSDGRAKAPRTRTQSRLPEGSDKSVADTLTVLVCALSHTASKTIRARDDGTVEIVGFKAGTLFGVMRRTMRNIRELSRLLQNLERMPNVMVIRGEPKDSLDLQRGVRRRKTNFVTPPEGRRWIMIDFDKIPLPTGMGVAHDAKAVAEYLVSLLPPEFHDASYHYQLSSSAGLKDASVASMHVWFWLDQPWPDKELKKWAKAVNADAGRKLIDPALFNDVQPHYVAAPVFEGMKDPFDTRSKLVCKARKSVAISAINPQMHMAETTAPSVAGERAPGFEAILARIGDHPGGDGFHEPIIRAAASYVAANGKEGTDSEWLYETLRKRVLEADRSQHDDDAYVEHMASREHIMAAIEGALEKYGNASSRRRARVLEGAAAHYPAVETESGDSARHRLDKALRSVVKVFPWRSK